MGRYPHSLSYQNGIGLISLLGFTFALLFLLGAMQYRLNQTAMTPGGDLAFRLMMLVYFATVGYQLVPRLAGWLNKQPFVIEAFEKEKSPHDRKLEYFLMFLAAVFCVLLTLSLITGTIGDVNRYGSKGDYDALAQTTDYWTNVLAGYFVALFVSTTSWQMRLYRISND